MKYFVAKGLGALSIFGKLFREGEEVPVRLLETLKGQDLDYLFEKGILIEVKSEEELKEKEKASIGFVLREPEKKEEPAEPDYEKLSLEELNLLVKEKDPEIEPFETKEEAIAFLRM